MEKPLQGCMGGIVNVFDMSSGMGGIKLLTNQPHRDGSPTSRNHADVASKTTAPRGVYGKGKQMSSDQVNYFSMMKRTKETPIKMLMAQEMSKETESKRKQTNIVARLMGLEEAVPTRRSVLDTKGSFRDRDHSSGERDYKDVYGAWGKEQCDENQGEKRRTALVHEKFIEAKPLALDDKLLQSKEFQDALEVLSSKRDLFFKFLEEPDSLLSNYMRELHSITPAPKTKRITILKPSRKIETMSEKQVKREQRSSNLPQPTKIVVLKPSPGKFRDSENAQCIVSREEVKDFTQRMRESLSTIRRDDSLLSSAPSTGYVGDAEGGDFSDSATATLTSRRSWDFSDRFTNTEPLAMREAKRLISERCSFSSNENGGERTEVQRSTSTLGEMLAISDLIKDEGSFTMNSKDEDGGGRSLRSLSRSKSVPVSSSAYENIGLKSQVPNSQVKMPIVPRETAKSKSGRLSFKGKISNMFFFRSKKGGVAKSVVSPNLVCGQLHDSHVVNSKDESFNASSSDLSKDEPEQGTTSFRDVLSLEKPITSETSTINQIGSDSPNKPDRNQDQPSPTSVLELPFHDDTSNNTPSSSEAPNAQHSLVPIESVARLLSWDYASLPNHNTEEEENFLFVQKLLSKTGFGSEKANMMLQNWHSVDSPLDTDQIDKFLDRKQEDAKSREKRSNQRLLFDCVNASLLDIGSALFFGSYPWPKARSEIRKKASACNSVKDEVWVQVRDWFSRQRKSESGETDHGGLVVDRFMRKEVGGNGWVESIELEVDVISEELGEQLLEELVENALAELTVWCLL